MVFTLLVADDQSSLGQKMAISLRLDQIQKIITSQPDEAITHIVGEFNNGQDLTHEENQKLGICIKLVVSLCLYNQITNGKYLHTGFPAGLAAKPKLLGMTKDEHKVTKGSVFLPNISKTQTSEHVRSGHFRQLVDERYYKGEYADLARGERWVEVKPTIVGSGTPYTQEHA